MKALVFGILTFSSPLWACVVFSPSFALKGTAFEKAPFQVNGNRFLLLGGTEREVMMSFDPQSSQWCLQSKKADLSGCLQTSSKLSGQSVLLLNGVSRPKIQLKDTSGSPYAELEVHKRKLTLILLNQEGQRSEKRIELTDSSERGTEILSVQVQLCANEKLPSCQGGRILSERQSILQPVQALKVSESGGPGLIQLDESRFWKVNCQGTTEVQAPALRLQGNPAAAAP